MSFAHPATKFYVYELPYHERRKLYAIFDNDKNWEELAATMNFDSMTIQEVRRVTYPNSPTENLLGRWGDQNHTTLELFTVFFQMKQYRAMSIIKPYVDEHYHQFIYEGNPCRVPDPVMFPSPSFQRPFIAEPEKPQITYPTTKSKSFQHTSPSLSFGSKPSRCYVNNPKGSSFICGPQDFDSNKSGRYVNVPNSVRAEKVQSSSTNLNRPVVTNKPNSYVNIGAHLANGGPGNTSTVWVEDKKSEVHLREKSALVKPGARLSGLPAISFKELEKATQYWHSEAELGKGGFGAVYRGYWKNTLIAVKRTKSTAGEACHKHAEEMRQILGELRSLDAHRHDNILPLYAYSVDGPDPCLIYQFMPNGSLEDRLRCKKETKPLDWSQRLNIAVGSARGLQFLHTINDTPLIHGDIKSANILLDQYLNPKLGDFGLAREGPTNQKTHLTVTTVCGTQAYLPWEFLQDRKLSTKVDTYCFGIVLFELATGRGAFDRSLNKTLRNIIVRLSPFEIFSYIDTKAQPLDKQVFKELIDLGETCTKYNPKERPAMAAALQRLEEMVAHKKSRSKPLHEAIAPVASVPPAPSHQYSDSFFKHSPTQLVSVQPPPIAPQNKSAFEPSSADDTFPSYEHLKSSGGKMSSTPTPHGADSQAPVLESNQSNEVQKPLLAGSSDPSLSAQNPSFTDNFGQSCDFYKNAPIPLAVIGSPVSAPLSSNKTFRTNEESLLSSDDNSYRSIQTESEGNFGQSSDYFLGNGPIPLISELLASQSVSQSLSDSGTQSGEYSKCTSSEGIPEIVSSNRSAEDSTNDCLLEATRSESSMKNAELSSSAEDCMPPAGQSNSSAKVRNFISRLGFKTKNS